MGTNLNTLLATVGSGATPWKAAVRVVARDNVATLTGLLTIDAVALGENDRVLLSAQTAEKDNGLYLAKASAWVRADDMAKASFAMLGTTVRVMEGSTGAGTIWTMTQPTSGSVRVGVDALTFTLEFGSISDPAAIDTLPAASFHLAPWDQTTLSPVSGAVDSATDKGGGSLVMSAANVASRPVLNLTGADSLNGNPSVSFTYDQGGFSNGFRSLTGAPTGPVPQALACVSNYKSFDASALQTLVTAGSYDAGATSWGAWIAATGAGASQDGGGYGRGCTTTTDADLLPHVHVSTYDGTVVYYYIDGFLVATSTPPAPPGANSVNTRNGKIGFYKHDAGSSLAAAAHYDAQWMVTHLSETQIRKYSRQCAEKFGLWKIGLVYLNGDSITACNTLSDAATNGWPTRIQPLLTAPAQVVNDGVGGRTIETIANVVGVATDTFAQFSGQRRFAPNKIGNIEIIWAGTNDNYVSSESAANIWADMQTRANASIAKGFVPILGTMLRRAGGTGGQETVRTTVNTSIRTGPYRYFDLAEHAGFLSTASVAQTVVGFSDGIHPTDQANIDVIAPAIAAVINAAIAEESPT